MTERKKTRTKKSLAFLAALVLPLMVITAGCSDDDDNDMIMDEEPNIVETAIAAGSFNTLVDLVVLAGLDDDLSGPGPFTVFAPTDTAFAALDPALVSFLTDPANVADLQSVLLYHVVGGRSLASDVTAVTSVTTLQGDDVTITINGNTVTLNAGTANPANIITTDIETSNGVIHVIDAVLVP